MKIIISLPDRQVREDLCRILDKRLPADTLEMVSDGNLLLEKVGALQPALLVMDILLPGKDGLSVLYELRRLPESQQPEVILLSSLASERIVDEVALLQPAYFTTLPCDIRRLAERILFCCRETMRSTLSPCNGTEQIIGGYLHAMGLTSRSKGYAYARLGVELIWADRSLSGALTKRLYPDIARRFGTKPACVERAIRSAITAAWQKDGILWRDKLFYERPTNGEFLTVLADLLREELREQTGT